MKRKAATLIFAITLLSTNLFSQATNEKIDRQIRDPKNAENSAKADVYVQKKKLNDSGLIIKKSQSTSEGKKKK
jgi:hypothetical protein